jgi:hypothetical protein
MRESKMYRFIAQSAILGDEVKFVYNGKERHGVVEVIGDTYFKVRLFDWMNSIKTFSFKKIENIENLTV